MVLNYSLKTPEERIELVNQILADTPQEQLSKQYLSYLSDYILFVGDKSQTKKERKLNENSILTKNREVTVSKRETSFENLVSMLENGEDGLYAMILNDKNQIMDPKSPISKKDLEEIPYMRESLDMIRKLEEKMKTSKGRERYTIKQHIMEIWQAMYIMKADYRGISMKRHTNNYIKTLATLDISDDNYLDENDMPCSNAIITLFNPTHVSFLLSNYSLLREECYDNFQCDMHFLLLDLEELASKVLEKDYPILWDLLVWKIDGRTNEEIVKNMEAQYGIIHSEQYFSTLWRKKIPKMIAEQAQKDFLVWYFTNVEYGQWKKCGQCGEIKLAHSMFFSKNSSKDGWYSICKSCRSKKNKK